MAAEKKLFINQLREGQAVEETFLVSAMSRAETRAGKPYLMLTLMDRTGEIEARLWENADAYREACAPGSLVRVSGQAQSYRNVLQLRVNSVTPVEKEGAAGELFLQGSAKDVSRMAAEITGLARGIKDPFCRKLLLALFDDPAFFSEFTRAPAAKSMHHAYLGGLLEHTLAVAVLADRVAGLYPALDRDLLLAGALLHDIGKTKELAFDAYPFDYTDRGRLSGHLVLGVEMLRDAVRGIDSFPEDLAGRLEHLILSHHGRYEFGSPTLPMISEAFVLNFLDDLDAKLNYLGRLEQQAPDPGYQWTDFQRTLERFLFVRGRPGAEPESPAAAGEQAAGDEGDLESKQQNLF
jgi:3'-5' exoribonuclease